MMKNKSDNIGAAILCLGLVYLGFEYDSVWCFVGAFVTFFNSELQK